MWKFLQADKNGTPAAFEDGFQIVMQSSCPPLSPQKCIIFSQPFTTDGTATGTKDLGIDGSVTPVEYYIPAGQDNDIYITRLSFILGYGAAAEGFEFADSNAPLANGVKVSYTDSIGDTVVIMNPKANYSFHRASGAEISPTDWEARGFATTGDYGYFVNIHLDDIMPPIGVKLDRATSQKMSVTIRDDCTDADLFNCQAFGFKRLAE